MINWAKLLRLQKQQFQNSPPDVTPWTTPTASPITPPRHPQEGDLRIVTLGLDRWCVEEWGYLGHGVTGWTSNYIQNSVHYSEIEAEKRVRQIRAERQAKKDKDNQIAARAAANPPRTVPPYKYINGE